MARRGADFYDDPEVWARYLARRERADAPNDTIEGPAFDALVGEVRGLEIVDLGCGDARWGARALDRGAARYVGVDGSERMCLAARARLGDRGRVVHERLEAWTAGDDRYDLCVSRLALHYVEPVRVVLERVHGALRPGGRFVLSVEHPVITSCDRARPEGGARADWIVDDYFREGWRRTRWMGAELEKYHRPLEDWFRAARAAGFGVEAVREARPSAEHVPDPEERARRSRIPLFLLLALRAEAPTPPGGAAGASGRG